MTTTTTRSEQQATVHAGRRQVLLGCGLGGAVAYVGAAVLFSDVLAGSSDAAEAARTLSEASASVQASVLLLTLSVLLHLRVVAELGSRGDDGRPSSRLLVPLGVGHLLLLALGFWSIAAAVSVGENVLGGGVTPVAAESGLVGLNTFSPLAALVAAAFFVAVSSTSSDRLPRWVRISAVVLAVGLVVPVTGWAVLYLVPLWFAAVSVQLARR